MKYFIQWFDTDSGRRGVGTKKFEQDEAENLVNELNAEFPEITHTAVPDESRDRKAG